ncbi:zinc finger MYM-type protein 1-like, partial [Aphis craccivora]
MYAKSNQEFLEMFEKKTNYSSWYIQNEILNISSNIIKENIIQELKKCGMYALVCDKGRSYKQEQMSMCVRFVDSNLNIFERFIGFFDVSGGQGAEQLSNLIIFLLKELNIHNVPMWHSHMMGQMSCLVLCQEARNFFNVLEAVYIHFAQPSRNKQLTDLQIKMNRLCETRWACRYKNCIAVKNNFTEIIQILEKEIEEGASRDVLQAI